jgi:hypothetical protein
LEGLPNCGGGVKDSLASGVLKGASSAGGIIVRSSAGFGSLDKLFVISWSSEWLFNRNRIIKDSEGTSLAGGITVRTSASYWRSSGLSVLGWFLGKFSKTNGILVSPDSGFTARYNEDITDHCSRS